MTVSAEYVTKSETQPAKHTPQGLDSRDVHLLRELLQGRTTWTLDPNFRKSFRSIARTLNFDEDTARSRVRRLEEMGFIQDWRLHPSPHILGLRYSYAWFDVPPTTSKKDLVSKLRLVPDMFIIVNWHGSMLGVVLAYDSPYSLRTKSELIQRLSNVPSITIGEIVWPDCGITLSKTDWMILASLQNNPRKSYVSISRDAGISTRTVERRLRRMIRERALFSMIAIDPKVLHGTVMAELAVEHLAENGPEIARRIATDLDEYMWHLVLLKPSDDHVQYTWFNLALPNVSKASEILDRTTKLPGVRSARVELEEDHIILLANLDHYMERKLGELGLN